MNKVKITCSQPVQWSSGKKPQKTLTYTHKEGGHNSFGASVTGFCAYLVNNIMYRGLKKFTIEVLDD